MSKVILEFNLPEESDDANLAMKAASMASAIFDIRQEVFRPARKFGYSNQDIQQFIDKHPESVELIGMLEKLFSQVLEEHDVLEHS